MRGDGGGGFGFLGFFCASVLTATLGNFATLNKKVVVCNMCWGFFVWLDFGWGFFNESLSSSEQACTDIYSFINTLTTERTVCLIVHSFCEFAVRCEFSTLV